jgi:hypothetical protein
MCLSIEISSTISYVDLSAIYDYLTAGGVVQLPGQRIHI